MKKPRVATLISLVFSLGTGRPGKLFLVDTEVDALFNVANVEAEEGKAQVIRVSVSHVSLASLVTDVLILHPHPSICRPPRFVII